MYKIAKRCNDNRIAQAFVNVYNQSVKNVNDYPAFKAEKERKKEFNISLDEIYLKIDNQIHWYNRKQEELDEQRIELQSKVINLNAEATALKEELKISGEINDIRKVMEQQEWKKEELETAISKLESQRRLLRKNIQNDQTELLSELTKLKPYIDILNGLETNLDETIKQQKNISRRLDIPGSLSELISETRANLLRNGRDYDTESLVNYLAT